VVVVVSLRKENNYIVIGLCVEMVYGVERGSGGYAYLGCYYNDDQKLCHLYWMKRFALI
jgi:hypothetical protein